MLQEDILNFFQQFTDRSDTDGAIDLPPSGRRQPGRSENRKKKKPRYKFTVPIHSTVI